MHKRPSLSEALTLLQVNNQYDVLDEYVQLKKSHGEFKIYSLSPTKTWRDQN